MLEIMKKSFRILILLYGIFVLIASVWLFQRVYFNEELSRSYTYVMNRHNVMGLFYEQWHEINRQYSQWSPVITAFDDKTPKFYEQLPNIVEGDYFSRIWAEARAEIYIRKNVYGAGIDSRLVKKWLWEIIRLDYSGIIEIEEIFLNPSSYNYAILQSKLSQILSHMSLESRLSIIKEVYGFPVMFFGFGFSLIGFIYFCLSVFRKYVRKMKTCIVQGRGPANLIIVISITIFGTLQVLMGQLSSGTYAHSKIYSFQILCFAFVFFGFIGFFGLAGLRLWWNNSQHLFKSFFITHTENL